MAGTGQFVAYPVAFDGFNLLQHEGFDFDPGVQFSEIMLAGSAQRSEVIADVMAPVAALTTRDLATLMAKTNILKFPLSQANGVAFYGQQREEYGIFSSGSNHFKIACAKGVLVFDSITVDGTSPAQANFALHELWNGTDEMAVVTGSEALGAAAPAFNSQYYRGSVVLDGSALTNVARFTISTGIVLNKPVYGGAIGPTTASTREKNPAIDISVGSLSDWPGHSMKAWGKKIATAIQIYMKKGDAAAMRGGSGTAMLISSASGHISPQRVSAQGVDDGMLHLVYRGFDDLAVNTGATHP